jgi:hypothetical protein
MVVASLSPFSPRHVIAEQVVVSVTKRFTRRGKEGERMYMYDEDGKAVCKVRVPRRMLQVTRSRLPHRQVITR